MVNPLATLFGLPVSAAESADADKIAFVIIDVPQALTVVRVGGGGRRSSRTPGWSTSSSRSRRAPRT